MNSIQYLEDRLNNRIKHLEQRIEKQEAIIQQLLNSIENKDRTKKCRRCGRSGHVIGECFAKYHVSGHGIDSDED